MKLLTRGLRKSIQQSAITIGANNSGLRGNLSRNFSNNYGNFSPSSGVYDPQSPQNQVNYGLSTEEAKVQQMRYFRE